MQKGKNILNCRKRSRRQKRKWKKVRKTIDK